MATGFLRTVLPPLTPLVLQAGTIALLYTGHAEYSALTAICGFAVLAFRAALANDRTEAILGQRDAAHRRIAALEADLADAHTDPVTGLPTRHTAEHRITDAAEAELTIALVDVDDMHGINNTNNHQVGDAYLALIGGRLASLLGHGDVAARLGGDEFVIITTRAPRELAHDLARAARQPISINGIDLPMQISVGICRVPSGDPHHALGCADLAMYTAKRRRSGIEHYDAVRDGTPLAAGWRPFTRHRDRRPVTTI